MKSHSDNESIVWVCLKFLVAESSINLTVTHNGIKTTFNHNQEDTQELHFGMHDEISLMCESKGSNPSANLSLQLGQKDLWKQGQDVPAKIIRTYSQEDNKDDIVGVILSYTTAKEVTLRLNHTYSGHIISCRAYVHGVAHDSNFVARFKVAMDASKKLYYLLNFELHMLYVIHINYLASIIISIVLHIYI